MNEANYKGEVKRLDFVLNTLKPLESFENLKPSSNYDNLYYAGFSRAIGLVMGMNATLVYRKTWWIQTSTVCGTGANPTLAMVVDRFAAIENFKPHNLLSYRLYIETSFSYEEGRF
jgi:DNA topoisomerase-3